MQNRSDFCIQTTVHSWENTQLLLNDSLELYSKELMKVSAYIYIYTCMHGLLWLIFLNYHSHGLLWLCSHKGIFIIYAFGAHPRQCFLFSVIVIIIIAFVCGNPKCRPGTHRSAFWPALNQKNEILCPMSSRFSLWGGEVVQGEVWESM